MYASEKKMRKMNEFIRQGIVVINLFRLRIFVSEAILCVCERTENAEDE